MRLENHDLEVLLPEAIHLLSKSGSLNIQRLNYQLAKDKMYLNARGSYGGLAVGIDLALCFFIKGGALGIEIERGYLDSALMKGDILPFLKTTLKNHPYLCVEDRTLYFYHPKLNLALFSMDENGIELTFK